VTSLTHFAAALAAAVLGASGCAANTASSVSTGGVVRPVPPIAPAPPIAPVPPITAVPPVVPPVGGVRVIADGGLFVSATIGLSSAAANTIAGIFILGILAAENGLSPLPPPRMREDRTINLQDCSKAIVNWSANLKCATPEELRELESAQRD
jgi:hypothetical protein